MDPLDPFPFDADVPPAERVRWDALRARVRADLDRIAPPRLLALHAAADVLDADERAELEASGLDSHFADHPALADAAARARVDRVAFEAAWEQAVREVGADAAPRARAADRPLAPRAAPNRWIWRTATACAVVLFAVMGTFLLRRDAGFEIVRTGAGETRTVTLADGSTARLAEGSELLVPEDGGSVRLRVGRAFFAGSHAGDFAVETPNAVVTVLGTEFGVSVTDVQTDVTLISGAVRLAPKTQPEEAVELEPGESSRVLALDAPTTPAQADLGRALEWTGTLYVAPGEPLAEVARRLAERAGVEVDVDPALAPEPVGRTAFEEAEPVAVSLDALARAVGARLVAQPGGFRIESAGE